MNLPSKWRLLCVGLVITWTYAFAQGNPMPAGFEAIHLGMNWSEVIAARPNAEIFDMFPEPGRILKPSPNQPKDGLTETLGGPDHIFKRVLYAFENGTLLGMTFAGEGTARQSLLEEISAKHGRPEKVALVQGRPNFAVATWSSDQQLINVILPVRRDLVNGASVSWQVFDRAYAEKIGAPGAANQAASPNEHERAELELVTEEINALLPASNTAAPTAIKHSTSSPQGLIHPPSGTGANGQDIASASGLPLWMWAGAAAVILTLTLIFMVSRRR